MDNPLLVLHIAGAVLLGILIIISVVLLLFYKIEKTFLRTTAILVALQTGVQLLSGSLLAFQKGVILSPMTFCRNIVLYLFVVTILEFVIFRTLSVSGKKFPAVHVVAPLGTGLLVAASALIILT